MREIVIGAAQMGPIQKADSRAALVERMITPKPIMHQRHRRRLQSVAYFCSSAS